MPETSFTLGLFKLVDLLPHYLLVFGHDHLGDSVARVDDNITFGEVYQYNTDFTGIIRISIILPYRLFIL